MTNPLSVEELERMAANVAGHEPDWFVSIDALKFRQLIAAARKGIEAEALIQAEREACAIIAERHNGSQVWPMTGAKIANAIRRRTTPGKAEAMTNPPSVEEELADLPWWQEAFEPYGCRVGGWTFKKSATIIDPAGNLIQVTPELADAIRPPKANARAEVEGVVGQLVSQASRWGHPIECDPLMRKAASLLSSISEDKDTYAWLFDKWHTKAAAAKAENERLREERDVLHARLISSSDMFDEELADAKAENKRLKEVLGGFVKNRAHIKAPEFDGVLERLMDEAAALTGGA